MTAVQGKTTGAAGTFGVDLEFTNTSNTVCTLQGYPATTLLDNASQPLGQPAQPNSSDAAPAITVQPQGVAYLTALFPNPGNFTGSQCSVQQASYVQVIPTGQTVGFKIPLTGQQYCPGFAVEAFSSTPS
jgi:hypothetical protein